MRFHSSVSDQEATSEAFAEVIGEARAAMRGKVDVAFLFFTGHHREEADAAVEKLWLELDPQAVVGCSAEGVIGGDREIERAPGVALLVGELPGVRLHPFHVRENEWEHLLGDRDSLVERLGHGPETRALIGFGDPYTTPVDEFFQTLDKLAPASPLVGGMASGADAPGRNLLVRNDLAYPGGFVGLSLSGPVAVDTVVSQGCRPIGSPMVVTKSRENVIEQLGGRPALTAVREMAAALPPEEKELIRNGLLIGRAISEYRESWGRGDFLVRNLQGANEEMGMIAVADYVKTGQTIQFHVRDAATAHEDLAMMLDPGKRVEAPAGGLLFSCNGRGTNLFAEPCHDIDAAHAALPRTPIAGFFAAGEFGPVGGKNFIHGHTASVALIRPGK